MIQFLEPAMYDLPHPSLDEFIALASQMLELLGERHGLNDTRLLLAQVRWLVVKLQLAEENLDKQLMDAAMDSFDTWTTVEEQEQVEAEQ